MEGGKHGETLGYFLKKMGNTPEKYETLALKSPVSHCFTMLFHQCVALVDLCTAGIHRAASGSGDFWLRWPCVTQLFASTCFYMFLPLDYAVLLVALIQMSKAF